MAERKRYNFKQILGTTVWILIGSATIVLLGAAMYKKDKSHCRSVEIIIKGVKNNFFIDKSDVNLMLEKMNFGQLKLRPLNAFDLAGMEAILERNKWIKSAELYFDNNDVLRINIMEREPIVRIFTSAGSSFYIDSTVKRLPLSYKFSARLPVFTNFPVSVNGFSNPDKKLLMQIRDIGTYILQDPFWMAQIEQVDITPQRTFEMIPKIGNQVIIFGSGENYVEKFQNLLIFYKHVQSKVGWNKYSAINVTYKDQVVAVKRGAGDIKLDSLKTIQLVKLLVANAQKSANDSINNIQLVQPKEDNFIPSSQQHDEEIYTDEQPSPGTFSIPSGISSQVVSEQADKKQTISAANKSTHLPSLNIKSKSNEIPDQVPVKKAVVKPAVKKTLKAPPKRPKAVMPPQNDY